MNKVFFHPDVVVTDDERILVHDAQRSQGLDFIQSLIDLGDTFKNL